MVLEQQRPRRRAELLARDGPAALESALPLLLYGPRILSTIDARLGDDRTGADRPSGPLRNVPEGVLIRLGVIAGDGVGPEVMAESLEVLGIISRLEGLEYELVRFDLGGERFLRTGDVLPEDEISRLARCDAILLGAVGHPGVAPGILEKGILLRLRFDFHQYVNLRPIQLYPRCGLPGPWQGPGRRRHGRGA